jgi:uncharacterized membrane protein YfcA
MDTFELLIAIVGGFLAGVINTFAGNGSAITLTILTEVIGLPGNLANGTNRIGIFFQGLAGLTGFYRNKLLDLSRSKYLVIYTVLGAVVGVVVAVNISNEQFRTVFKYLMVGLLILILFKPSRWLRETDIEHRMSPWLSIPVFALVGFYGGFIQMGMGVFFLGAMVLIGRFSLLESNVIKNFVVTIYTLLTILIFQLSGFIDWQVGLIMAIGQATGGWVSGNYLARHPKIDVWAYRLLVVIIFWAVLRVFGIFDILYELF